MSIDPGTPVADVTTLDRTSIQSIDRASHVLELFDQDTLTLSAALVAERLGLNRTTAHRYLMSMQASGLLSKDFGPGPLLDQLSTFIAGSRQILQLAPDIMRSLSDETNMTVVLSLWGRSGAVVALVEDSTSGTIVITVRVGTRLEHFSAQTGILLAYQSDPVEVERYLANLTDDERRRTNARIAKIRRDQLSIGDLDHLGLAAIAAPVFGSRNIQAAMALIGTTKTLSLPEKSREVGMLQQAAERLSKLIDA